MCQREVDAPRAFRVALPGESCMFNACVSLDLLYMEETSALHAVEKIIS